MSVTAVFKPGKKWAFTEPVYRYDYGQTLRFEGIELPETFVVHFSNTEELGVSVTAIGQDYEVKIPNEFLRHNWDHLFAWVFIGDRDSGETKVEAVIPVKDRPGLVDPIPSPIEESIIQQAIGVMDEAIEKVDDAVEILDKASELIEKFESGKIIIDAGDAEYVCGGWDDAI